MDTRVKLAKHKQLLGVIIAAGMLAAIFIPFQTASAFTVTIDLPDDDGTISQSAAGTNFEIVIDVEASELISIDEITLIRDNGLSSVALTVFNSTGHRISGSSSLVSNNELTISGFSDSGYAFGSGLVTNGITGPSGYSYSFPYSNTFIGTNNVGYANAGVTDFVTGLIGPGQITISGKLRTADLSDGAHTLDVTINTGAGVDPDELTTAGALSFTVEEDDSVVVDETPVSSGATTTTVTTTDSSGNAINVGLSFGNATTTTGNAVVVVQNVDDFIAANNSTELAAQGLEQDGDTVTFNSTDSTNFIAVGFIMDIDVSALGLPDGTEITINMDYDDSILSESQEDLVRLMHQTDDLTSWEPLSNDDNTINGGDEVDTTANIVYGTTDDFSLFGPAVSTQSGGNDDDDDDDNDSNGGGGGGGGGTVTITWPTTVTKPDSYFVDFPLDKIQISNSAFINAGGISVTDAGVGQQISIAGTFTNYQESAQTYAFIIQVINDEGFATDINWQQGSVGSGSTIEVSTSWTPSDDGDYEVKIFVWDGVSTSPTPLSQVTIKNIEVS